MSLCGVATRFRSLVARASEDAHRLLEVPGRPWEIAGEPAHDSEVVEGAGPYDPFAALTTDFRYLLQDSGRARVVPGQPPRLPQVNKGVELPARVAEVPGDAQRLLQVLGRAQIVPRSAAARLRTR